MERRARVFSLIARLILGGIFIYASVDKIADPAAFAKVVYNYQILPDILINLTAIMLPWLELVLGVFLVSGFFREGSVSLATLLLVIFLSAMVFNLARGLDIDCGCFSTSAEGTGGAAMVWYVIRDSLFLIPALYLSYHTFRTRPQEVAVEH
ncbi:MAG: DoxX family membrane protein [Deltaproteobacteria bacterium]|nr:DoxX family membrane protein [Deltaproteobacteria bacterium]